MQKITRLMLASALLLGVVLATVNAQAQDTPSGELVVALPSDPTSLYLPRAADRTAGNAAWSLYNSLLFMTDDGELVGDLATDWEISEDGREYTFFLREGVTFHNGEPFDAEAVVATWEFGQDASNDYAGQYSDVIEVIVVDDMTVTLVTAEANPVFLTLLADNWAIIPPAYMREVGIDAFEAAPVGTGPFVFVERALGDRIVMEANPDYWEAGLPKVERVVYRVIPDSTTRVAAIQTGEVDIVNRLSVDEVSLFAGNDNINVISYPNDRVYYVGFKNIGNGVDAPTMDPLVRQALNLAVNREGILAGIFAGEGMTIAGFTVSTNLGYDDSIAAFPYDVERARELLAEAGYGDGFSINMGCPTDAYPSINEVCLAVQRDLSLIGIDVTLEFKTSNSYWAEPGYATVGPMYVDSWSSAVGEALPRLQGALTPEAYYNTWVDDTIVEFVASIETTVDREERAAIYAELQQYMQDNPPFIYLYQLNLFEATTSRVEGYAPRPAENYYLKGVSVND